MADVGCELPEFVSFTDQCCDFPVLVLQQKIKRFKYILYITAFLVQIHNSYNTVITSSKRDSTQGDVVGQP